MKKLFTNCKALVGERLEDVDILFDEEKILKIADDITDVDAEVIDLKGKTILPGLIDVHVHLRDPGLEYKETIETGTRAALAGGFTTILAMPNVKPCPDRAAVIKPYLDKIAKESLCHVYPYGAMTLNLDGKVPTDYRALKREGIRFFSDDGGLCPQNYEEIENVCKAFTTSSSVLSLHCEERDKEAVKRVMFEGKRASELGIVGGMTDEAESVQIEDYSRACLKYPNKIHICHVSCLDSVNAIKKAADMGVDISAEVTCHHLTLTENDVVNADFKMSPPLKSEEDRRVLVEAIKTGVINIIASDHAPHGLEEKNRGLEDAPFGIVGLETSFPVLYTELVRKGVLTLSRLVECMSKNPAIRFSLDREGEIREGYKSDFAIVDLDEEYQIDKEKFYSKGRNTPYDKKIVYGKIIATYVDGIEKFKRGENDE